MMKSPGCCTTFCTGMLFASNTSGLINTVCNIIRKTQIQVQHRQRLGANMSAFYCLCHRPSDFELYLPLDKGTGRRKDDLLGEQPARTGLPVLCVQRRFSGMYITLCLI